MHAIILAGGFGTRLNFVAGLVPKPLAMVNDKPFIALLLERLAAQGVTSATLAVHYEWQQIRDYFLAYPPAIALTYSVEEKPLGTGGAMALALANLPKDQAVLALNGDCFVDVDIRALHTAHVLGNAKLTMVLREVKDTGRYGWVTEQDGIITGFRDGVAGTSGYINAGVYMMQPDLFDGSNLPNAFSFEKDFLPSRLAQIKPRSFHTDGYFIDIGIPEDYARACAELPELLRAA